MDKNLERRKKLFISIFLAAKSKYEKSTKRLAGEGWSKDWELLFATMMSAQTKDETTIPTAEELFKNFNSLKKISSASEQELLNIIKKVNYNKTKAKNIRAAANILIHNYNGKVPDRIEELIKLPGVGRKTANLVLGEIHNTEAICVDTHVHRISNVLGIVKTKTPAETEQELMKVAPKIYWNQINRLFVLWGKEVPGRDAGKLLGKISLK